MSRNMVSVNSRQGLLSGLVLTSALLAQAPQTPPATPAPTPQVVPVPEPKLEFTPRSLIALFPSAKEDSVREPMAPEFVGWNKALFPAAYVQATDPDFVKFKAAISAWPQDGGLNAALKFLFLAEEGGGNPAFVGVPAAKVEIDPKLNEQALLRFYSILGANPFISEMWRASCRAASSGTTPADLIPSLWNRKKEKEQYFQLSAANRLGQAVMRFRKLAISEGQRPSMLCKDYRLVVAELLSAGKLAAQQCDGQHVAQRIVASSVLLGVLVTSPQLWGTDMPDNTRILFAAQRFAAASVFYADAAKAAETIKGGIHSKTLEKLQVLDEELQRLIGSTIVQLQDSTLRSTDERGDVSQVVGSWSNSVAILLEQAAGLLWSSAVSNGTLDAVTTKALELAPFISTPVSIDPMKRKDSLMRRVIDTAKGLGILKSSGASDARNGTLLLAVTHQGVFERPGVFEMLATGNESSPGKLANLLVFEQNFRRLLSPEYLTLLTEGELNKLSEALTQQQRAYARLSSEGVAALAGRQYELAKDILSGVLSPALQGEIVEPGLSSFDKALAVTAPVGADGKPTGAPPPLQANFNQLFIPGSKLNESLVELEALSAAGYRLMQELRDGPAAYQAFRSRVLSSSADQGGLIGAYEIVSAARRILEDPEHAILIANDALRAMQERLNAINQAGFELHRNPENCAEVPVLSELRRLFDGVRRDGSQQK